MDKIQRRMLTQTPDRDILVSQSEAIYIAHHGQLIHEARSLIERWISENARGAKVQTDAIDVDLLKALRGIFDNPANARAIFGKLAGLINSDVETTVGATIPTIARVEIAESSVLAGFARTNAQLIKNVGSQIIEAVSRHVLTKEGAHVATLQRAFERAAGVSESRARLWARDQTLKLHSNLTQERHTKAGIQRYYWTDSNDERVRWIHGELGERSDLGETFSYKDPPVMSEDGRRGNPGEDYQCRCTAFPVLD